MPGLSNFSKLGEELGFIVFVWTDEYVFYIEYITVGTMLRSINGCDEYISLSITEWYP